MTQHSPTPWDYMETESKRHLVYSVPHQENEEFDLAEVASGIIDEANAEFIIRAVNNHAALVEALDNVTATLETMLAWANYKAPMTPDDKKQRTAIAEEARALIQSIKEGK